MNVKHFNRVKQISYAIFFFVLFSSLGLWAWNTFAELFVLPHAQYKHVIAVILLGLFVRWIFSNGRFFGNSSKFHGKHFIEN